MSNPTLLVGLLILSLLCSCHHDPNRFLTEADNAIEEHPDSALMILNGYSLPSGSTAADSAYYSLLLTHARYKNFIDETDDSLISVAAAWFTDHRDSEKASRALFLQGMIQMNANRLGEAAVSFRKGLDIARDRKLYMWEGQCARGLFAIYGRIKNYSEQIKYAQAEYEAFEKGDYPDWANHARLNILRAYNNNEKDDKVLADAPGLLSIAEETKDTLLMKEVLTMMGTCRYSTNDFKGALDSYRAAYSLNPSAITATHGYNIAIAAANLNKDSLSDEMNRFLKDVVSRKESLPAFKVLANQGRFEEAYNGLERYKNYQDSVLQVIRQNNVSESMDFYENITSIMHQKEVRTERVLWGTGLLVLAIIICISYWVYKKKLSQKDLERRHLEMSMEILQSDLASQMHHLNDITTDIRMLNKENERMSTALHDMLYDRYKKINDLCDSYYQDRIVKSKKKQIEKDMESLLKDFSDRTFLKEAGKYIDLCLDGLHTSFTADFPDFNEDNKRLFTLLTLGLSNRTICVILNLESANLYNRKSRLKKYIAGSNVARKEEYLKNIR